MRRLLTVLGAVLALGASSTTSASGSSAWTANVPFTNVVASSPTTGGGYPVPPGSRVPVAGTCYLGPYNANHSESWLAVKPGTEHLVGSSKFFFDRYSTFYMFHLGSYTIQNGTPVANNQVQGYDCVSTGTQDMPPSWTQNTDPNVAFDTQGRVYQTTLPFNSFFDNTKLHPNGAIDVSYSDDMGLHWVKGNGGRDLEESPNSSPKQLGHVEDKQWIAVNAIPGHRYQDHVYAMWSVFNKDTTKIRIAVSRDRGHTFSKAVTITDPSQTGPSNTYIYPSVDAAGDLYIAFAAFPMNRNRQPTTLYVAKSVDDGVSFSPFVPVTTVGVLPVDDLPNTTFRDGITENLAAGPNGAVAVAFYDRRSVCPAGPSVLPADVGQPNFCIDTSLQAYKDTGGGAQPIGGNARISQFTWDPENPAQTVGGLDQMACASGFNPCAVRGFIGDYFGLAISAGNIYALFVSTHYPSNVTADGGGPVYYQQQVLATVPRAAYGPSY